MATIYNTSNPNPDGRPVSAMDIKSRYLEQDNRMTMLKERLAKRAGQDAQVLAERDLRQNTDLRSTLSELNGMGVNIASNYTADGQLNAPGTTTTVTYAQALEAAERLRYRATTETDVTRRTELETAAQHFEEQAVNFRNTNATYTQAMVDHLANPHEQEAIRLEAQANAATDHNEQARLRQLADRAMDRSRQMRARLGQNINYDHYLSNNLAGRRQKIINPDIADEINTQVISNSPRDLVNDVMRRDNTGRIVGDYGTGEARGNFQDMANILNGRINEVDEAPARAGVVQLGAIHSVMKTARHGDVAGLETINGFNDMMQEAGRPDFKATAARNSLGSMNERYRPVVEQEIARQFFEANYQGQWERMSRDDRMAAWGRLTPEMQNAAIQDVNFAELQVKGAGADSTAQKDFVDRYLRQVEEDPAIRLSSSAGSRFAQARDIPRENFTENQ